MKTAEVFTEAHVWLIILPKGSIISRKPCTKKINVMNCLKFSVKQHEISSMWLMSISASSCAYYTSLCYIYSIPVDREHQPHAAFRG